MSIDFSVNTFNATQVGAGVAQQNVSSMAKGAMMGQVVEQVSSPLSLLADAAEEMTFGMDTTDEFELEERKERKTLEDILAERLELYKNLMHKVGKTEEMNQFKDSIRSGSVKDGILKEVKYRFPDSSDAWAVLQDTLAELEKEGSCPKSVLTEIRSAIDELEAFDSSAIKAGFIGATSSLGFEDLDGTDALRDFYRQTVCDFDDATAVFKYIQEQYGSVSFDKAMDFLFSGLSADLATDVPSMEKTHLENVYNNLSQVRLLQSTHTLCDQVLTRWEKVHNQESCPLNSMDLLGSLVSLGKERFLGAMHIDAIATKAKATGVEDKVLFLQELMMAVRQAPPLLYDGNQGYAKVMDAVQQAVDNAIQVEDDYYASME